MSVDTGDILAPSGDAALLDATISQKPRSNPRSIPDFSKAGASSHFLKLIPTSPSHWLTLDRLTPFPVFGLRRANLSPRALSALIHGGVPLPISMAMSVKGRSLPVQVGAARAGLMMRRACAIWRLMRRLSSSSKGSSLRPATHARPIFISNASLMAGWCAFALIAAFKTINACPGRWLTVRSRA